MTFRSSSLFMCLTGGGVSYRILADFLMWRTLQPITKKSYLIGSDTHFFKYKTAFLAIQFICDRRTQCGTKHVSNSVFYM